MYRIVVLSDCEKDGQEIVEQTKKICAKQGLFPTVELYLDQEKFFAGIHNQVVPNVIVALSGVEGLNAVEHLKSLCSECRLIWFSDLDFSLQAYRVRADYFMLNPISETELREGISVWMDSKCYRKVEEVL